MRSLVPTTALFAAALLCAAGVAQAAPQRWLTQVPQTELRKGTHTLDFQAPTTQGRWILSVEAQGRPRLEIRLNGQRLLPLARKGAKRFLLDLPVQAGTNQLRIRQRGPKVRLRVDAFVPEAELGPNPGGRRVASLELLDETLQVQGWPWYRLRRARATHSLSLPPGEAYATLRVDNGWPRVAWGRVRWQGTTLLDPLSFNLFTGTREAPLTPATSGQLRLEAWGRPGAQARFRAQAYVVDETAPTIAFTQPANGGGLTGNDPITLTFDDAGSGIDAASLRITLNGTDVTSAFQVASGGASATLADLPQGALQATNTLSASVADLACNEASADVTFTLNGQDTTPPTLTQPPNLEVDQTSPAGAVVTFTDPSATDDLDPNPTVACTPPSGSTFAPGVTTVTCTATDASGNQASVTFTVTVRDATPPVLSQPPNLVVEQTTLGGAVVTYTEPSVSDDIDPSPTLLCAPPSGSTFSPGITTVTCMATDAAGNQAFVSFTVTVQDTTPPALSLAPAEGVTFDHATIATLASYSDVSAVTSFSATLDGVDVTANYQVGATSATWTAPSLEDGPHVLSVSVIDAAGNAASAVSNFTIRATPTALELTISPGDPSDLAILSENDLQIRAISAAGTTATSFTGFVLLATSDTREPLHGLVLDFASADQGQVVLNQLLVPRTLGVLQITARSLVLDTSTPGLSVLAGNLSLAPRTIDGTGNNLVDAFMGSAGETLLRLSPSDYSDGDASPAGAGRPSPRAVSNAVHRQRTSVVNQRGATDLVWVWGQFVDHDLSLTPGGNELLPIPVPSGDPAFDPSGAGGVTIPFRRSGPVAGSSPRQHPNEITTWLDGSMVYGSDATRQAALRALDGSGRLRVQSAPEGDLLPNNVNGLPNDPTALSPNLFLAGDVRANENVLLTSMHTLWVREHNRLADALRASDPLLTGDEVYERVRRRVIAQLQAITYREWLPVLLGPGALAPYQGYDSAAQVGVFSEFSTAAYRMGHSLLSPKLLRLDANLAAVPEGPLVELRHAFFSPNRLRDEGGIDPLLRGATLQVCQRLDVGVVEEVRSFLFGPPGSGGLDLAALNIQRGRDHGLPAYNAFRRTLGLTSKASFAEISSDPAIQASLAATYASVEEVDLWTGALAEDRLPGAMVGELVFVVLKRQFELLRDGDRYWYEIELDGTELAEVEATHLSDVIRRNTSIRNEIPDAAFAPFEASLFGGVQLQVTIDQPLFDPPLPSQVGEEGALSVTGYTFPNAEVELLANGAVIATTQASEDGTYSFNVTLAGGNYAIQTQSTNPATNAVVASESSSVTVADPITVGLRIEPAGDQVLSLGETLALRAIRELSNGQSVDVTTQVPWGTSEAGVASVSSVGLVTALAPGATSIFVTDGSYLAERTVQVELPRLMTSSPLHGEGDVALTRETILTFSTPLDPSTVTAQSVFASFAGQNLPARLHLNPARTRLTLFYSPALPPSARVRVTLDGDVLRDTRGNPVDVDGDGVAGGSVAIDFDTLTLTVLDDTAVCGRVFASELAPSGQGSVNVPLAGVTITVDGAESTLFTTTDSLGNFRLEPCPAGRFFVHIDGRTATIGVPTGAYYPFVGKTWTSVPAAETNVGDVYLPLVQPGTLQTVSQTDETVISFSPSVLSDFPHLAGTEVSVPGGSLFKDDGTPGTQVGIAPVPPDRLPGELPEGLDFSLVFTVQTDGATNFDEPVAVRFPNLDGLAPGAKTALWSFNHDTGEWNVVGSMTVTEDGQFVETDPGSGILAPGWHGVNPGTSGSGGLPFLSDFPGLDGDGNPLGVPGPNGYQLGPNGSPLLGPDGLPYPNPGGSPPYGPPMPEPDQAIGNDDGKNAEGCPSERCSVSFHNGEERTERVDLSIPGRGDLHFELRRSYRSRVTYDGPLGHNWSFSYHEAIYAHANGDVSREDGFGHVDRWSRLSDETYLAPQGYWGTLRRKAEGGWVLRKPNGMKHHYYADGRLRAREDRVGNRMLFDYDSAGRLAWVIDPYGREIKFGWAVAPDGCVRISYVRDFAGREVQYTYDTKGDLTEVRSPVVLGTSTGNDFPNGRTERYTYSSGFSDERLNHNLLSITLPEEVANGGPPFLQWTYGTDPSDPDSFDRVLTLEHGGANLTGVAAGGTKTFSYASLSPPIPGPNPVVKRVTFTDRNGNVTEYDFDARFFAVKIRRLTRGVRAGEPAFYETVNEYDQDGQLVRTIHPEGNETRFRYQSGPRAGQSNVVEVRRVAGPRGGGEDLVTTYTYEPLYNQISSVTDPRGNAQNYVAPVGTASAARYTSQILYDYQEHTDPLDQAEEFGIDLSSVPRGLGDLNEDGRTDQSLGRAVQSKAPTVTLYPNGPLSQRLGSPTQEIVTQAQWNDCGQPIGTIDAEGNVTTFAYHPENDPDGDGRPVFSLYLDLIPAQRTGYLQTMIVDAATTSRRSTTTPPAALRSDLGYDPVGNLVFTRNPRGVETRFEVTSLNETIVSTRGAEVTEALMRAELPGGTLPLGYVSRNFRDHNGRVVRTEVENRDSTTVGVGAFVDGTVTYDILDNPVATSFEVDDLTTLVTQFRYDPNENLVTVTKPEGNQIRTVYDERDLAFTVTRGFGALEASTTRRDYDLNGNLVKLTDAEDNDGDGMPEFSTLEYDGFDRLVLTMDPLGNQAIVSYDVASNQVRTQAFGHPAGLPGAPNVLLAESETIHDELNRPCVGRQKLFLSSGFTTSRTPQLLDEDMDGWVTTVAEFDALSRTVFVMEDDGQVTETVYDGVSRPVERIDALGNRSLTAYDRNSNPIASTSVEVSPEGLVPTEAFTTRYVYDQLDRLVRATDSAGQTSYFAYDSRDNLVQQRDPEGPVTADPLGVFPGQINGPGNSKTYVYDGLNRMIRQVCDLRVGGTGAGALDTSNPFNPDGQISLSYEFDGNSRLTGIVDDNGNRTRNRYDALNRRITHIYAIDQADTGGRRERFDYVFDRDSNVRQVTDPNGTVVTKSFDALNRMTATSVARAAGVGGTTTETFEYDGLSRLTRCTDDNGSLTTVQTAEKVYDSLSRLIEERQNGQAVSNVFTGDSKRLQCTYPGGRVIRNTFDAIDRVKTINDTTGTLTQIAASDWIGPGLRELRRLNANGTKLTFLNDAENADLGYDAVQRITRLRVLAPGGASAVVDREYGYNRASVRTSEMRNDDFGLTDSYSYDSMYRVVSTALDTNGLAGATPRATQQLGYTLDGVGNRRKVDETTGSGTTTEDYAVNQVNQYTTKGGVARSHSRNGNLLGDGTRTYVYDYKNRLTQVARTSDGAPIADYLYHCDNRRSVKVVYSATQPGVIEKETRYFYDGWQVCEDQSAAGASELTYVYSPVYIDEPVQLRREAAHPLGAGVLYTHQNARADVVSVTDAAGAVVEQRFFDDFGKTYDETKALAGASAVGNPYGFQGRRFDSETGLYYFRNRIYHPETGRFLQRDPVWDAANVGGQYTFAGSSPVAAGDALGLQGPGAIDSLSSERAKFAKDSDWQEKARKVAPNYFGGGGPSLAEETGEELRSEMTTYKKAAHAEWCSGSKLAAAAVVVGMAAVVIDKVSDLSPKGLVKKGAKSGGKRLLKEGAELLSETAGKKSLKTVDDFMGEAAERLGKKAKDMGPSGGQLPGQSTLQKNLARQKNADYDLRRLEAAANAEPLPPGAARRVRELQQARQNVDNARTLLRNSRGSTGQQRQRLERAQDRLAEAQRRVLQKADQASDTAWGRMQRARTRSGLDPQ